MAEILASRMTARIDGEIAVFLIGMRFNRLWKVHKWLPVVRAMRPMIRELSARPELGFRGAHVWFGRTVLMLQYWRSIEDLLRYARDPAAAHLPAWAAFNRAVGSGGDVGIWHETYRVSPGSFECVYVNMPAFGLARATTSVPAAGPLAGARGRLNAGHAVAPAGAVAPAAPVAPAPGAGA